MDFSAALLKLKSGKKLFRWGWNGVEAGHVMCVYLVDDGTLLRPSKIKSVSSSMALDPFFILYHGTNKTDNVWFPSIWDIMATDWEVYYEKAD